MIEATLKSTGFQATQSRSLRLSVLSGVQRFQSRLSGNWDASTLKLDELVGSPTAAADTERSEMNRLASMPAGRSPKGVRRVPSNSQVVHASDDAGLTGHMSDDWSHGARL